MEPAPQLQPVNPPPQVQYAEPPPRPLQLQPGPQPLRLPGRRPLDIKYGPPTPRELIRARTSPLANPLNVVKPVINNPLGFAPGRGLASLAAGIAGRATDPATFGVPAEPLAPLDVPALPSPNEFSPDAVAEGPIAAPGEPIYGPAPYSGGQSTGVAYKLRLQGWTTDLGGGNGRWHTVFTASPTLIGPVVSLRISSNGWTGSFNFGWPRDFTIISWLEGPNRTPREYRHEGPRKGTTTPPVSEPNVQIIGIVRADGQPDTGGDPQGPQIGETAPTRRANPARSAAAPADLPAPGPMQPYTPLPVPFFARPRLDGAPGWSPAPEPAEGFVPDIDPPTLPVPPPFKLPPPPTLPGLPGGGTATTTGTGTTTRRPPVIPFPPVLPGPTGPDIAPPRLPLPPVIFIPPLKQDECCAEPLLRTQTEVIRKMMEDLEERLGERCKDLCDPALITTVECQDVAGELQPVSQFEEVFTLARALEMISAEIASIKRQLDPCQPGPPENVAPILIGSGSMTDAQTVAYVPIGATVRQVELIVTGQVPNSVRLYETTQSGEQQGKFGAIAVAYPGVTGGFAPDAFQQWAWTRRTLLDVGEPLRDNRHVRVYLRAGLSWVLYDTGIRT